MGKSRKELVENKLKNEVYSEILYKLNVRRVSLYEFAKEFDKSRIALLEQVRKLEEDGFVRSVRVQERNRVVFFIDWEMMIKAFVDFLVEKAHTFDKVFSTRDTDEHIFDIQVALQKSWRQKSLPYHYVLNKQQVKRLIANPLFTEFFQDVFVSIANQKFFSTTIHDFFNYLMDKVQVGEWDFTIIEGIDARMILYNPLDPFGVYKMIYEAEKVGRSKQVKREITRCSDLTKKEKDKMLLDLKLSKFNAKEMKDIFDFAVRLPLIMDFLRKDIVFENALVSMRNIQSGSLGEKEGRRVRVYDTLVRKMPELMKTLKN